MRYVLLTDVYCGHSEIVAGKETIITHSLQHSDMVKTSFDLLPYPQVGVLNDG